MKRSCRLTAILLSFQWQFTLTAAKGHVGIFLHRTFIFLSNVWIGVHSAVVMIIMLLQWRAEMSKCVLKAGRSQCNCHNVFFFWHNTGIKMSINWSELFWLNCILKDWRWIFFCINKWVRTDFHAFDASNWSFGNYGITRWFVTWWRHTLWSQSEYRMSHTDRRTLYV